MPLYSSATAQTVRAQFEDEAFCAHAAVLSAPPRLFDVRTSVEITAYTQEQKLTGNLGPLATIYLFYSHDSAPTADQSAALSLRTQSTPAVATSSASVHSAPNANSETESVGMSFTQWDNFCTDFALSPRYLRRADVITLFFQSRNDVAITTTSSTSFAAVAGATNDSFIGPRPLATTPDPNMRLTYPAFLALLARAATTAFPLHNNSHSHNATATATVTLTGDASISSGAGPARAVDSVRRLLPLLLTDDPAALRARLTALLPRVAARAARRAHAHAARAVAPALAAAVAVRATQAPLLTVTNASSTGASGAGAAMTMTATGAGWGANGTATASLKSTTGFLTADGGSSGVTVPLMRPVTAKALMATVDRTAGAVANVEEQLSRQGGGGKLGRPSTATLATGFSLSKSQLQHHQQQQHPPLVNTSATTSRFNSTHRGAGSLDSTALALGLSQPQLAQAQQQSPQKTVNTAANPSNSAEIDDDDDSWEYSVANPHHPSLFTLATSSKRTNAASAGSNAATAPGNGLKVTVGGGGHSDRARRRSAAARALAALALAPAARPVSASAAGGTAASHGAISASVDSEAMRVLEGYTHERLPPTLAPFAGPFVDLGLCELRVTLPPHAPAVALTAELRGRTARGPPFAPSSAAGKKAQRGLINPYPAKYQRNHTHVDSQDNTIAAAIATAADTPGSAAAPALWSDAEHRSQHVLCAGESRRHRAVATVTNTGAALLGLTVSAHALPPLRVRYRAVSLPQGVSTVVEITLATDAGLPAPGAYLGHLTLTLSTPLHGVAPHVAGALAHPANPLLCDSGSSTFGIDLGATANVHNTATTGGRAFAAGARPLSAAHALSPLFAPSTPSGSALHTPSCNGGGGSGGSHGASRPGSAVTRPGTRGSSARARPLSAVSNASTTASAAAENVGMATATTTAPARSAAAAAAAAVAGTGPSVARALFVPGLAATALRVLPADSVLAPDAAAVAANPSAGVHGDDDEGWSPLIFSDAAAATPLTLLNHGSNRNSAGGNKTASGVTVTARALAVAASSANDVLFESIRIPVFVEIAYLTPREHRAATAPAPLPESAAAAVADWRRSALASSLTAAGGTAAAATAAAAGAGGASLALYGIHPPLLAPSYDYANAEAVLESLVQRQVEAADVIPTPRTKEAALALVCARAHGMPAPPLRSPQPPQRNTPAATAGVMGTSPFASTTGLGNTGTIGGTNGRPNNKGFLPTEPATLGYSAVATVSAAGQSAVAGAGPAESSAAAAAVGSGGVCLPPPSVLAVLQRVLAPAGVDAATAVAHAAAERLLRGASARGVTVSNPASLFPAAATTVVNASFQQMEQHERDNGHDFAGFDHDYQQNGHQREALLLGADADSATLAISGLDALFPAQSHPQSRSSSAVASSGSSPQFAPTAYGPTLNTKSPRSLTSLVSPSGFNSSVISTNVNNQSDDPIADAEVAYELKLSRAPSSRSHSPMPLPSSDLSTAPASASGSQSLIVVNNNSSRLLTASSPSVGARSGGSAVRVLTVGANGTLPPRAPEAHFALPNQQPQQGVDSFATDLDSTMLSPNNNGLSSSRCPSRAFGRALPSNSSFAHLSSATGHSNNLSGGTPFSPSRLGFVNVETPSFAPSPAPTGSSASASATASASAVMPASSVAVAAAAAARPLATGLVQGAPCHPASIAGRRGSAAEALSGLFIPAHASFDTYGNGGDGNGDEHGESEQKSAAALGAAAVEADAWSAQGGVRGRRGSLTVADESERDRMDQALALATAAGSAPAAVVRDAGNAGGYSINVGFANDGDRDESDASEPVSPWFDNNGSIVNNNANAYNNGSGNNALSSSSTPRNTRFSAANGGGMTVPRRPWSRSGSNSNLYNSNNSNNNNNNATTAANGAIASGRKWPRPPSIGDRWAHPSSTNTAYSGGNAGIMTVGADDAPVGVPFKWPCVVPAPGAARPLSAAPSGPTVISHNSGTVVAHVCGGAVSPFRRPATAVPRSRASAAATSTVTAMGSAAGVQSAAAATGPVSALAPVSSVDFIGPGVELPPEHTLIVPKRMPPPRPNFGKPTWNGVW